GIDLKPNSDNEDGNFIIHRAFNADNVPSELIDTVLAYHETLRSAYNDISQTITIEKTHVKRIAIQLFNTTLKQYDEPINLSQLTSDELKTTLFNLTTYDVKKNQNTTLNQPGRIDWQFAGINQFGSISIRIKNNAWQVEFSRLQRPIDRHLPTQTLLTQAHQAIYTQLEKSLQPIVSSEQGRVVILQGTPGHGKTHVARHYFYHYRQSTDDKRPHQTMAWLSGRSKAAFEKDWTSLANQLRQIQVANFEGISDDEIIRTWCEQQLGQWLFIIDDVRVDAAWLHNRLPTKGGHVLITTCIPNYTISNQQTTLLFKRLSMEDSTLLLHSHRGKAWEATGYPETEQLAIRYFSQALGGSAAAIVQLGLLAEKKGISFSRLREQFEKTASRELLLQDTIYDQLDQHNTFLGTVTSGWQQLLDYFENNFTEIDRATFENHLKNFVTQLHENRLLE
ncbi:MAG: hypothetical protein KDH94_07925, partial [Coxiellaceae bacterium]|nr:hypothetical protein [Coxiellaceae bacterium]